jgi:hypothetical protein
MATSNTAIKITSLPNIGNNIAPTTLIPVVNMAGVPITQKANLQTTGNLILAGAGTANFVPAALANLAYTVVNSNQANITRLGTLNINTFKVSGGLNGQYIQTDGTGNLAWVSGGGSGNGVVGGSNTQIQYNNAGNFGGSSGLTWNGSTGVLSTLNLSVSTDAIIYGNTALTNLNVADNLTSNNIFTDNYYYANGTQVTLGGNSISNGNSNVSITANGNITINAVGGTRITATSIGANITGTLISTGKIGYASGGVITQSTSRNTAVTLNALSGAITLFTTTMIANEVNFFTMTNSTVNANDMIVCSTNGGNTGSYLPMAYVAGDTQVIFTFRNLEALASGSEAPIIKFIVIKAPIA